MVLHLLEFDGPKKGLYGWGMEKTIAEDVEMEEAEAKRFRAMMANLSSSAVSRTSERSGLSRVCLLYPAAFNKNIPHLSLNFSHKFDSISIFQGCDLASLFVGKIALNRKKQAIGIQ